MLTDEYLEKLAEKHIKNCWFDTLTYARAIEAAVIERCAQLVENLVIETVGNSAATADQCAAAIRGKA